MDRNRGDDDRGEHRDEPGKVELRELRRRQQRQQPQQPGADPGRAERQRAHLRLGRPLARLGQFELEQSAQRHQDDQSAARRHLAEHRVVARMMDDKRDDDRRQDLREQNERPDRRDLCKACVAAVDDFGCGIGVEPQRPPNRAWRIGRRSVAAQQHGLALSARC